MRQLFLLFWVMTGAMAWEAQWQQTPIANGTSRIVVVQTALDEKPTELYFDTYASIFLPHPTRARSYYAWISVAYDMPLGSYPLGLSIEKSLKNGSTKSSYAALGSLEVVKGDYPKEELRVSNSKVHLTPADERRIEREFALATKLYATTTPQSHLNKPMTHPMQSQITSHYGNERVFNGLRKSYHSGVDFRAKTPQPIYAIADGRVVLVGDRFYAGKSVVIDHGEGVYSGYFHMSRIAVREGELVAQGANLGKSGATGRITGPHLHMMLKIGGNSIDPIQAMEAFNRLFEE